MEITVSLSPNWQGLVNFEVTFSRPVPGMHSQEIRIDGDFEETDEPLSVLRQKAEDQAKSILLAFAAAVSQQGK
jgi:hypothetical protein